MSQGGVSAGHVDLMSIWLWARADCCVATSKTPDVMTRHLFHVVRRREGILAAFQLGRGHGIPGLGKAVPENPAISPFIVGQVGIVERLDRREELTRERELRQRQFEYHLDKLVG